MIKRDTIQRIVMVPQPDGQGGSVDRRESAEILTVAVSIIASAGSSTEFGIQQQMTISVVSNVKLDEYIYTRYEYSGRLFKLLRQVKRGSEYYAILTEVND